MDERELGRRSQFCPKKAWARLHLTRRRSREEEEADEAESEAGKMAGQYTYDTTGQVSDPAPACSKRALKGRFVCGGQSSFFILTVLLCVLLPFTWSTLRGGSDSAARSAPYPCQGWNEKTDQVRRVSKRAKLVSTRSLSHPFL